MKLYSTFTLETGNQLIPLHTVPACLKLCHSNYWFIAQVRIKGKFWSKRNQCAAGFVRAWRTHPRRINEWLSSFFTS